MRPSNSLISKVTSCSNSYVSSVVYAWGIVQCSYQAVVSSGTCVGRWNMQGSNENPIGVSRDTFIPTNWNTLASSSFVVCSSGASSYIIPKQEVCYSYLRVVYVNSQPDTVFDASIRFQAHSL